MKKRDISIKEEKLLIFYTKPKLKPGDPIPKVFKDYLGRRTYSYHFPFVASVEKCSIMGGKPQYLIYVGNKHV